MEVFEDEDEGVQVVLHPGDDLGAVPEAYRYLITPEVEAWWRDPNAAMQRVAEGALGPQMQAWFRAMTENGRWRLNLHETPYGLARAGFEFSAPGIRGAEVGPPSAEHLPKHFPPDLAAYYRIVGHVDWMGFGMAGGLEGALGHSRLTSYPHLCEDAPVDPSRTYIFGWSPGGDMLIYTLDGRAGWLSHETSEANRLRSIPETLEWVYGELLANRCPDSD